MKAITITNVRTEESETHITLLAGVKIRPVGWDTAYLKFEKKYKDFLVADASPFAAALLFVAMHRREDLIIDGSVSKKFYDGMHKIMDVVLGWNWEADVARIKIHASEIVADNLHPDHVATFFSGGVDSFYTYLKHKQDQKDKITHLLFVRGNDIELRNKTLWEELRKNIQSIAKEEGVAVIEVESNIQALVEPIMHPDFTHGGSLASIGLALRAGFKKIYIPASFTRDEIAPYGTHPDIDALWSSETLSFEHDGMEASRMEKLDKWITESPVACKYLRICYANEPGTYNCGRCEKCMRTMVALYANGKLDRIRTLPHTIDHKRISDLIEECSFPPVGHKHNLRILKENNIDPELQAAIEDGIRRYDAKKASGNSSSETKEKIVKEIIYLDHMYLRGMLFRAWLGIRHPF